MQSELTVMLVAHRPLPLLELRNKFLDRHARIAAVGPFSDQPEALPDSTKHILANLKKRWTGEANLSLSRHSSAYLGIAPCYVWRAFPLLVLAEFADYGTSWEMKCI